MYTPLQSSVVALAVTLAVVLVVQENILVSTVHRKCHRRGTQTWQAILESVPPAEETCVSPLLTVFGASSGMDNQEVFARFCRRNRERKVDSKVLPGDGGGAKATH